MRKPKPWDPADSEIDVRNAARDAAQREGLSLSEWLAQAIAHRAIEIGMDPVNMSEDDRLDAIAVRLRRLGIGGTQSDERRSDRAAASGSGKDCSPKEDEDVLLQSAAARLDEHADVETLVQRLRHLEAGLARRPSPDPMQPFKGALARLEARLDSLAHPIQSPLRVADYGMPRYVEQLERVESKMNLLFATLASSAAMPASGQYAGMSANVAARRPSLGDAIAEIMRRQRALETPRGAQPAEDQVAGGVRFGSRRPERAESERGQAEAFGPVGGEALASLKSDISSLVDKVEEIRRGQAERAALPPAACNLDQLRAEIATMSDALRDLGSRGSFAPLDTTIRNLTQQIESSRIDGFREAVLQPLEQIERQVQALTERFDRLHAGTDRREEADLQAVADELRTLLDDPGRARLVKIEGQLDAITQKVEEAIAEARDESRYTALADHIDDVRHELIERITQGMSHMDTHAVEDLVRSLSEKIEDAHGPQADSNAIEALQRQVSEFAARLDHANAGSSSLTSLEKSIGDLFAEFEKSRDLSYAAAERGARSVLQEAFAGPLAGADNADVARDLAELRTMQDEAGRRTLITLNAVHETLEKVVDRLAMVESEISDGREPAPGELLASGRPPNFAPAPMRGAASRREPPPFVASREMPDDRASSALPKSAVPVQRPESEPPADKLEDFLIEPGRGFPGRRDHMANETSDRDPTATQPNQSDASDATSSRAGFIAAARRAAQAAQMESAAAMARPQSRIGGAAGGNVAPSSLIEQTRHFIANHKRPVVLSVAALFLAVGAYAVVKTVAHSSLISLSLEGGKEVSAVRLLPKQVPGAAGDKRAAAAATPSSDMMTPNAIKAPSGSRKTALQAIPGSDPIVTGAIGAKPVQEPREASLAVLQSQAAAGNAKAQYLLATNYTTGHDAPRDMKLAAQWYEKAAAQGLPPAQYRLGSLYEKGLGVRRDLARAMVWYRKAAEAGNARAMHNLAVLAAEGGESGKPDYATAAQWFHKASEYGVHDSQYNLAILLARGLGVKQNLALSYTWFAIAAAQGDADAGRKRDDVGTHLGAADLAAAKASAAAFHPKTPDPAANEVMPLPERSSGSTSSSQHVIRAKVSQL